MRVYFVRHGESESFAQRLTQGHDSALSGLGRHQAKQVAERFRSIPLDLILSSRFIRAEQTALILHQELDVPLERSDLFHEWKRPSETYGKDWNDPEMLRIFNEVDSHRNAPQWHFSDEENFFDFRNRVETAVNDLSARSMKAVLVVSHGALIVMLLGWVCFGEQFTPDMALVMFHTYQLHNTGICEFELGDEGKWQLVTWNDHVHLENLAI